MSQVIPFRAARPTPAPLPSSEIAALSARLISAESAESPDEDMMELFAEAEAQALHGLAARRADTLRDAALKLTAVTRRATAADGYVSQGELDLMRSTLRDLLRMAGVPVTVAG